MVFGSAGDRRFGGSGRPRRPQKPFQRVGGRGPPSLACSMYRDSTLAPRAVNVKPLPNFPGHRPVHLGFIVGPFALAFGYYILLSWTRRRTSLSTSPPTELCFDLCGRGTCKTPPQTYLAVVLAPPPLPPSRGILGESPYYQLHMFWAESGPDPWGNVFFIVILAPTMSSSLSLYSSL
jgi:hypothetical protein